MLDTTLPLSMPALLVFVFVVASACWALGSLLSREPSDGPFRNRPFRSFNLLDVLAVVCFVAVVTAVSFFLVHYPAGPLSP